MNVDPRGLTVQEWTSFSTPSLSRLASVPVLGDQRDWQQWALAVIQSSKVSRFGPPDPRHFDNWQDWAFRFNQAVPL